MNLRTRMMIRAIDQYRNVSHRMNGMISLFENYTFPARKINRAIHYSNMRYIMEYNRERFIIPEEEII